MKLRKGKIIPRDDGKRIEEFVGAATTGTESMSVARMLAPPGWSEPAQTPEFDEVTLVLDGAVHVEHDGGVLVVSAGQAVLTRAG
ncbi:MAG TPA: rRNA maturation factor, partial [Myxococcaceae bacterium]|nr:rRNA maturation factor [Myxococcaceae bacterium]